MARRPGGVRRAARELGISDRRRRGPRLPVPAPEVALRGGGRRPCIRPAPVRLEPAGYYAGADFAVGVFGVDPSLRLPDTVTAGASMTLVGSPPRMVTGIRLG